MRAAVICDINSFTVFASQMCWKSYEQFHRWQNVTGFGCGNLQRAWCLSASGVEMSKRPFVSANFPSACIDDDVKPSDYNSILQYRIYFTTGLWKMRDAYLCPYFFNNQFSALETSTSLCARSGYGLFASTTKQYSKEHIRQAPLFTHYYYHFSSTLPKSPFPHVLVLAELG